MLLYYVCVYKHTIDAHTYVCLLIVSHFIVLIIVNVLEKLTLNCQVSEAKGKVDREKMYIIGRCRNPRETILIHPLSVTFLPISSQLLITIFV